MIPAHFATSIGNGWATKRPREAAGRAEIDGKPSRGPSARRRFTPIEQYRSEAVAPSDSDRRLPNSYGESLEATERYARSRNDGESGVVDTA